MEKSIFENVKLRNKYNFLFDDVFTNLFIFLNLVFINYNSKLFNPTFF